MKTIVKNVDQEYMCFRLEEISQGALLRITRRIILFLSASSSFQQLKQLFSIFPPHFLAYTHCASGNLIPAGLPHQLQLLLHCLPNLGPNEKSWPWNRTEAKSSRGFSSKRAQIRATRSCCCRRCCCCYCVCCIVVILQFLHFIYLSIADIFSCLQRCLSLSLSFFLSVTLALSRSAGAFPIFPFVDAALQICIRGRAAGGRWFSSQKRGKLARNCPCAVGSKSSCCWSMGLPKHATLATGCKHCCCLPQQAPPPFSLYARTHR